MPLRRSNRGQPRHPNRGGPGQKGASTERPPCKAYGGYRPGGDRPVCTSKIADGETIKVGKTKSAVTTKPGKPNAAIAEAEAIIGRSEAAVEATVSQLYLAPERLTVASRNCTYCLTPQSPLPGGRQDEF